MTASAVLHAYSAFCSSFRDVPMPAWSLGVECASPAEASQLSRALHAVTFDRCRRVHIEREGRRVLIAWTPGNVERFANAVTRERA